MTLPVNNLIIIIAVCAVCTFALRAIPFVIFGKRNVPKAITYLGKVLPMSVMTILVIYCIKGIRFDTPGNFIPTFVGILVTSLLHLWRKNTFISIAAGTIVYMLLIQAVF